MPIRQPNLREMQKKKQVLLLAEADRCQLLLRQPFIGSIIMRMDLVPVCDSRLTTASTDASNIYLDCTFYASLNAEERIFLLAHEVWHCVFLHFARRQRRHPERWNVAADLEIQFAMAAENMKNPHPLPFQSNWADRNAEAIYDQLHQNANRDNPMDLHLDQDSHLDNPPLAPQKNKKSKPQKNRESSDPRHEQETSSGDEQQPEENLWPDAAQQAEQQAERQSERQPEDNLQPGAAQQAEQQSERQTEAEQRPEAEEAEADVVVIDPEYAPFFVSGIIERTRGRVVSAARQVERMCGRLPASLSRLLPELLDPSLRWQELLAQFVTSCYAGKRRWLPPSRRHVGQGLYLPSLRGERLKAVVTLDTSGSTQNEIPLFFAELNGLLGSFGDYELTVIQCDAAIQDVSTFSNYSPCPGQYLKKAKGLGGTNFRPVFDYIGQHPEIDHSLLIFFTDGYGPAPALPPSCPVLWLLCRDGKKPAEWGTVVYMQ